MRREPSGDAPIPMPGSPDPVPIVYNDPAAFHRARIVLEQAGIAAQYRQPGGNLGPFGTAYGLWPVTGTLWVAARNLDRAVEALEEAGLPAAFGTPALVDRHDPTCPQCGSALDPSGPARCGQCQAPFQWLDIDEAAISSRETSCPHCGYNLRGTKSDRCPECGASVLIPDESIAVLPSRPTEAVHRRSSRRRGRAIMIGLVLMILPWPFVPLVVFEDLWSPEPGMRIAAAFVIVALIAIGVVIGRGMMRK